jgi:hypothetical protein
MDDPAADLLASPDAQHLGRKPTPSPSRTTQRAAALSSAVSVRVDDLVLPADELEIGQLPNTSPQHARRATHKPRSSRTSIMTALAARKGSSVAVDGIVDTASGIPHSSDEQVSPSMLMAPSSTSPMMLNSSNVILEPEMSNMLAATPTLSNQILASQNDHTPTAPIASPESSFAMQQQSSEAISSLDSAQIVAANSDKPSTMTTDAAQQHQESKAVVSPSGIEVVLQRPSSQDDAPIDVEYVRCLLDSGGDDAVPIPPFYAGQVFRVLCKYDNGWVEVDGGFISNAWVEPCQPGDTRVSARWSVTSDDDALHLKNAKPGLLASRTGSDSTSGMEPSPLCTVTEAEQVISASRDLDHLLSSDIRPAG